MAIYIGFNTNPVKGLYIKGMIVLGANEIIPETLLLKLKPQNNTGLGSDSVRGNVLPTRNSAFPLLEVVNTYLTDKLTEDELKIILNNRDKFEFAIGVGDRRPGFIPRFVVAQDWHGEDVSDLQLIPDPPNSPTYNFRLSFSADTGMLTLTDSHFSTANTYGSLRYFTVRVKP